MNGALFAKNSRAFLSHIRLILECDLLVLILLEWQIVSTLTSNQINIHFLLSTKFLLKKWNQTLKKPPHKLYIIVKRAKMPFL